MRAALCIAATLPSVCTAFLLSQPQRTELTPGKNRASSGASWRRSMLSTNGGGGSSADNLFAVSSSGFPSLGDGFPSMSGTGGEGGSSGGFPTLGDISVSRPPKRGVLVRNVAADASYEIRVVDKDYKLGITAVVESIAVIKQARFALCHTKDRGAAILDDLVFPVDVDAVQMAPLIKQANTILRKKGVELLWTAHTLTVKGLDRPVTEYLKWKKPLAERLRADMQQQGGGGGSLLMLGGEDSEGLMEQGDDDEEEEEAGMEDDEEDGGLPMAMEDISGMEEELDPSSYERMDAAFFADVNDEEYVGDSPEGLDKRPLLLEADQLAEFDYKRAKYKVVVYEEPVTLVAQWMEEGGGEGTWRLLKSIEAELVEDAIAYQQLQNLEVEMVDA